ncbi:MAG: hypothetical protein JF614_22905 [Acidobacteria bacterium]|nr:hypothetical protein [Acidobacteriota bacterium]
MLSATITVSLDASGSLQYQSSDTSIVLVTGSGSGTRLRLGFTVDESTIQLTFTPGAGIVSLDGLTTPSAAFGGGSITSVASDLVLTCTYLPLYEGYSFPTELQLTRVGGTTPLFHDPTIVFNPPSTMTQPDEAPVTAEPVMV